ncbi:hypothetical protein RN001_012741 [Aquatica leii]|uniref:Chitin-binding type-2 domain-containing protein n=1 Tax=Aquatica leii TaxID=1421715 RepID=A0AAN7PT65_9COLE|nr:hypothetical protein RN001_012741 [Aquatica leii]
MIGVSVFIFIGLCAKLSSAQFLNHRPYPTYSLEHMPDTEFSCRDKILGGYYADPETQCQMFHVCVKVSGVGVQDFRFLCPNGTAFDQDHQICADWQDVDCDATTLYYSSDNFDLYRIGSGFESKAYRYGEEEEPFSLQRAETGDVRINREHQVQRVNQQKETYGYKPRPDEYQQQNSNRNYNNNNNNKDDIFKGSSSSNFFNNRNGGKETDDDDYESAKVNANQDNDQTQRRKQAVRKTTRRPTYEEQTEKPRSTGFINNFAGSSYKPTTTTVRPVPTTNNEQYTRQRQRGRVNPQYNNADNFRQTTNKNYEDDGRYRAENNGQSNRNTQTSQFTVSTPSPFKQTQENKTPQYNPTTLPPRSTENYPPSFNQDQARYNERQKTTNTRKENYPTFPAQTQTQTQAQTQTQTKTTDNYSNFKNNPQGQQQYYNDQYETTKTKSYENYPSEYNTQNKKLTTPVKQADNYPTTYSPKFNKDYKTSEQYTTASPQQNPTYTQTNQQDTTYNRPSSQYTQNLNYQQQYDNSRTTSSQTNQNQAQTYRQTGQINSVQQQKQTTQYTQYTPTVPRITTPYYSPTTVGPRRSHRYDETQYDDGSYNSKYENDDDKSKDDEFLKTAHSINIANSRNEYNQNNVPVSTTQKPRPFSVTPNAFRPTEYVATSNTAKTNTQNTPKPITTANKPSTSQPIINQKNTTKKSKDVSYDYAYYDTNVGSDHEYDLVDIEKSDKSKSKTK